MPNRKLVVTSKQSFGNGQNLSTLIRLEAVDDPADLEAVAMNAGLVNMAVVARLAPTTDVSGWVVGQKRILDINL